MGWLLISIFIGILALSLLLKEILASDSGVFKRLEKLLKDKEEDK